MGAVAMAIIQHDQGSVETCMDDSADRSIEDSQMMPYGIFVSVISFEAARE